MTPDLRFCSDTVLDIELRAEIRRRSDVQQLSAQTARLEALADAALGRDDLWMAAFWQEHSAVAAHRLGEMEDRLLLDAAHWLRTNVARLAESDEAYLCPRCRAVNATEVAGHLDARTVIVSLTAFKADEQIDPDSTIRSGVGHGPAPLPGVIPSQASGRFLQHDLGAAHHPLAARQPVHHPGCRPPEPTRVELVHTTSISPRWRRG